MAAVLQNEVFGDRITYANTGSAITAGSLISLASGATGMCAIAVVDIAASTGTGAVQIRGRFGNCPKASGEAFTQGQLIYFDGTNLTGTSSTTFTRAGRAGAAAASAATTCVLILNQP